MFLINPFECRSGTLNGTVTRKPFDCETQRATQYRNRVSDVKLSSDLCNGTEWDTLSQKIWAKFDERRQPQGLYEKKISLWVRLCQEIKVKSTFNLNYEEEKQIKMCKFYCSQYSRGIVCIWLVQRCLDLPWIRRMLICVSYHAWVQTWIIALRLSFIWINFELIYRNIVVSTKRTCSTDLHHRFINHFTWMLFTESFLTNFNLIPAKVPILRFDDTHHNIEVDLNYNNCVGIRNSHLLYCYTQRKFLNCV